MIEKAFIVTVATNSVPKKASHAMHLGRGLSEPKKKKTNSKTKEKKKLRR